MAKPEEVKRLAPSTSVLKKLFAYSGNQCAMPDCKEPLVDKSGTMLGKVAHIHAAETGGARFERKMTNEERRLFENLFIVCGKHHDIIDDAANEEDYPAELLKKYKAAHEERFKRAERQLIEKFVDSTQSTKPKYPKNLRRLVSALGWGKLSDEEAEIAGVCAFIDNLKELPLEQRAFALKLAERMHRTKKEELDVHDVMGAFNIGKSALKKHMGLLSHWHLGDVEERPGYDQYAVTLWDREAGGNPWLEILHFCDATGESPDDFIYDLRFDLYDD